MLPSSGLHLPRRRDPKAANKRRGRPVVILAINVLLTLFQHRWILCWLPVLPHDAGWELGTWPCRPLVLKCQPCLRIRPFALPLTIKGLSCCSLGCSFRRASFAYPSLAPGRVVPNDRWHSGSTHSLLLLAEYMAHHILDQEQPALYSGSGSSNLFWDYTETWRLNFGSAVLGRVTTITCTGWDQGSCSR